MKILSSFDVTKNQIDVHLTGEYVDFLSDQPIHYAHLDILKIDHQRAYNFHKRLSAYTSEIIFPKET